MIKSLETYQLLYAQRWRIMGIALLLLYALFPTLKSFVMESRSYRDISGLTAFHSVVLNRAALSEDGHSITLAGTFIKRRCQFMELVAYTTTHGIATVTELVPLTGDPARGVANRAPLETPQSWGPWQVYAPEGVVPDTYAIYARHDCPDEPRPQTNLFVAGAWANYP